MLPHAEHDQSWPPPPLGSGAAAEALGEVIPAFKRLREKSLAKRVAKSMDAPPTKPPMPPKPAQDATISGYRLPYKDD